MWRKKFVAMLALMAVGTTAQAALQRLDGVGFDLIYDDALIGLFGSPALPDGRTLVFTPTSFAAESATAAWDLTRATLNFDIEADIGYALTQASLVERGDYILFGGSSKVFVGGQTRAFDYRTPTTESVVAIAGAGLADLGERELVPENWEASSVQSFASGATRVRFTLQSLLGANAGSGSDLAFIEKTYVGLGIGVAPISPVPEAGTIGMMLSGLGVVGLMLRRRR